MRKSSVTKNIFFVILSGIIAGYFAFLFFKLAPIIIIGAIFFILIAFLIFQNPLRGIYLIALTLTFERIGSLDIKGLIIRPSQIIMIITIIAWLISTKISIKKNILHIPLLLFLIINLISLINSPNLFRSLAVFCFTVFVLFLTILIPNLITKKEHLKKTILFLFLGCLITSIFGLFQFIGDMNGLSTSLTGLRPQYTKEILGFTRVQSTALEPLYFANYLLIPLILSIILLTTKNYQLLKINLNKLLPTTVLILSSINLILTVSRGAYIAFGIALLLIIIISPFRKEGLGGILKILIATIVILTTITFSITTSNSLNKFFTHTTNLFNGSAWTERLNNFSLALNAFKNHPIIGNGIGSYGSLVSAHPYFPGTNGWKIVNNEYLELLAETGILGLGMFMALIIILFFYSFKAFKKSNDQFLKSIALGFSIALIAILIQYNTFSVLYLMHIWFVIGIIVAIINIIDKKNLPKEINNK